jgi:2-oxoglutarate dehydrogenase E2 component (dihydrolipoamide succinyltransferase)
MALEMKIPALGESISEVRIATWLKKDGEFVNMDDALCEVETDKATMELNAEKSGILHIVAEEGADLKIGDLFCKIEEGAAPAASAAPAAVAEKAPEAVVAAPAAAADGYAKGTPSPAASKILAEKGMDAAAVSGSGRDGRITKEDAMKAQPAPAAAAPKAEAAKAPVGERTTRDEKMSKLRQTIAKRLVAVKNETAMLTTFNEVDMKPLMDLRAKYKDAFKEKHQIGLGFISFFTKAVCMALQDFPAVNAQINGDEVRYHSYCDVSIAVSTEKGLMVPVIRNAELLSLDGIEKEIKRLALRARDGKLSIDEMSGGTFSITNGGVFGSMLSTPIINPPQSAILGMHNIVDRPVAINGSVEIRPIMYVALSYDHRIIDGKESVSFLVRVKELLEDPARMLLMV